MNVSEAVLVGMLATLSHPPRTKASVRFMVDPIITVQKMHGNCAAPGKGLRLSIYLPAGFHCVYWYLLVNTVTFIIGRKGSS